MVETSLIGSQPKFGEQGLVAVLTETMNILQAWLLTKLLKITNSKHDNTMTDLNMVVVSQ